MRAGHLSCVYAQILELVLDQAAVAVGHVGDLLDPCQVHRGVRLRSSWCMHQALTGNIGVAVEGEGLGVCKRCPVITHT